MRFHYREHKVRIVTKGCALEFSQGIDFPGGGQVTVDLPILPTGGIVRVMLGNSEGVDSCTNPYASYLEKPII